MAVLSIEQQLALTNAKILEIQSQMRPIGDIVIPDTPVTSITMAQIQDMIDKGVASRLEELAKPPEVIDKPSTPLECINLVFTPSEVAWLCNPAVLRGVDAFIMGNFIQTEEGKDILRQIYTQYREHYESKS